MASEKLKEMLNDAIAREMAVSIQYMWQHIKVTGLSAETLAASLRQVALTEMLHAELIGERLDYLGGDPTTQPAPINVGKTNEEMLEINVKLEEDAIALYKDIISLAEEEKDYTTRKLFEQILEDEENHHGQFEQLLGR